MATANVLVSSGPSRAVPGLDLVSGDGGDTWGVPPHRVHCVSEGDSCEFGSQKYLVLCGFGGILSCGTTHTAVVPLDLVKCRMQVRLHDNGTPRVGLHGRVGVTRFCAVPLLWTLTAA